MTDVFKDPGYCSRCYATHKFDCICDNPAVLKDKLLRGEIKADVSTTIKKRFMDQILAGSKIHEYKADTAHWRKRLLTLSGGVAQPRIIVFLCGNKPYWYHVRGVRFGSTPMSVMKTVGTLNCFTIRLGERLK